MNESRDDSPRFKWELPLSPRGVAVQLKDGSEVVVRPVRATDKQAAIEGFAKLSPQSRYRRFFTLMPTLSDNLADRLTDIDHHTHRAWAVFDPHLDPEVGGIAVARLITDSDDGSLAEAAFAVLDSYQGRGVGQLLLDMVTSTAALNGIETIRAHTLRENRAMIGLLRSRGARSNPEESDGETVALDLSVSVDEADTTAGALYELIRYC